MRRLAILLMALLIGAAAPARAWCEAACLAPESTEAHCPTHEPASTDTAISATSIDNCPAITSARPTTVARIELNATIVTFGLLHFVPARQPNGSIAAALPGTTVFQRHTPLRI